MGYSTRCISMYDSDMVLIDAHVRKLKARGFPASRSQVLRLAMRKLKLDSVSNSELDASRREVGSDEHGLQMTLPLMTVQTDFGL